MHPYGEIISEDDIKKVNRLDLIKLHQSLILENSPEVFICGDFNESNIAHH